MKRTPITRTGFKNKITPSDLRVAGLPWPASHMTEAKFQAMVEADAHTLGWMASHSHLPFFDTAGWPDLALVHPRKHRFMVRELKVADMKGVVKMPKGKQAEWISALALCGIDVGVWRWPHDRDLYIAELSA